MTEQERRAQVEKAIEGIIEKALVYNSNADMVRDILRLRDPDGEPMVMVRDTDQTGEPTCCEHCTAAGIAHRNGFRRVILKEGR